jgi:hypothetical protein
VSRFDQGRCNRILLWTGAALAWGSALVAVWIQPASGDEATIPEPGQVEIVGAPQTMPGPAHQGLLVIRSGKDQITQTDVPPPQIVPAPPEMTSSGS